MSASISWNSPDIVRDGLVLYLDAGTSNSYNRYSSAGVWRDVNGNNITGSLINGPVFDSANGGSILFDGINDGVNCGNSFDLQYFTAISWISSTNISGYNFIFSVGSYNDPVIKGWGLTNNPNSTILNYDHCDVVTVTSYSQPNLFSGNWYQVGIFRDTSNNAGIIVNGVIVASVSYSATFTNSNFWIGQRPGGTVYSPFFKGNIAITQVYNRALSASEVLQNYNATKGRFGL